MSKRSIVIDADGHVMESMPGAVDWEHELDERYRSRAPRYLDFNTGGGRVFMDGKIWAKPWPRGRAIKGQDEPFTGQESHSGMWEPEQRLRDMDLDGTHRQEHSEIAALDAGLDPSPRRRMCSYLLGTPCVPFYGLFRTEHLILQLDPLRECDNPQHLCPLAGDVVFLMNLLKHHRE